MAETLRRTLYIEKAEYERIKAYCKSRGMTVNGLIKALLDRYMNEVGVAGGKNEQN